VKYKTIVGLPLGHFGSTKLWHNPLYAIQNGRRDQFEYLGSDETELSEKLGIPKNHLPNWFEWAEYKEGKLV